VTEVVLHDSYHVATLDHDAPRIFAESLEFVRRLAPAAAERR
jgi:carboxylesterase